MQPKYITLHTITENINCVLYDKLPNAVLYEIKFNTEQHPHPQIIGLIISLYMLMFIVVSFANLFMLRAKLIISLMKIMNIYPFIAYLGITTQTKSTHKPESKILNLIDAA